MRVFLFSSNRRAQAWRYLSTDGSKDTSVGDIPAHTFQVILVIHCFTNN